MAQDNGSSRRVIIGKINGIYGVNGGLKVFSYTQPREQIFSYQPWLLKLSDSWVSRDIVSWQGKGKGLVVFLEGITDPEQARNLLGMEITVNREQLPYNNALFSGPIFLYFITAGSTSAQLLEGE